MIDSRFTLDGKIALVTGGGCGIGLAFVHMAAKAGVRVVIADLCLSDAGAAAIEASEKLIIFVQTDVRKRGDLENAITVSTLSFGDVPDVYVANAGVFEPRVTHTRQPKSVSRQSPNVSFDSNLTADFLHPLKLTRLATRALLGAKKSGVVDLVSSTVGLSWSYPAALYCATKHALIGFTRSMAPAESLNRVRVVCLCPGIVDRPLWQTQEGLAEQFSISDEISITADDVAAALVEPIAGVNHKGRTVLKIDRSGLKKIEFSAKTRELNENDLAMVKNRSFAPLQEVLSAEIGRPWSVISEQL
ncbi:hypothetical protein D6C93_07543 [Aureobasidium pullulans]|uniref:NAD(P)-binding protein n=1 Tax=Aureobasidium pullulans TaxID=5580 RepID=A0A4S9QV78_AURPU|nr:hypothetical protein D6D24_07449 [Aureobasidium pullulans]THW44131.1 hypothetical protein D6D21_05020 [Aureobasidium pullulans]THX91837.1 hypothetical protein D6D03_10654 [Aureobasidium pullulans]THY87502.1 hypothetical protein D6C93_07543 [Aureobasidium pullulans]TIA15180.1 hypothetical protein D6C81_06436 [Aureobasidium pullulans]